MGVADIHNLIEIDGRTTLAGQPSAEQLRSLREAGYEFVINLAQESRKRDGSAIEEAAILGEEGLGYHHIPVSWEAPERARFDRFAAVMDGIGGRRVLVHCVANYRVTAFYSSWAVQRLGWSEARADALIERIWESRPDVRMSEAWRWLIADMRATPLPPAGPA